MYLKVFDVTEAFEKAYQRVSKKGEKVSSRIGTTKHLTNVTIEVAHPELGVCLNPQRNMSLKYMIGEIKWYMSGSNKVADIAKYAKMWASLSDDGETVNSAYGYRIQHMFGFDQLQYCIDKLKQNPYDRQCVIHIKDASNKPTKDTPCTVALQFTLERGKLNMHTYMRSNDIWLGLPYDMAFFTCLQQIVAKAIGAPLGSYYHTVGDLHLYEKHWNKGVVDSLITSSPWCFADETEQSIQDILDGKEPKNKALRTLWMFNHEKDKSVSPSA